MLGENRLLNGFLMLYYRQDISVDLNRKAKQIAPKHLV